MPNITISKSLMSRLKIMYHEDMKNIVIAMEEGATLRLNKVPNGFSAGYLVKDGVIIEKVRTKITNQLIRSEILRKEEYDNYTEYTIKYNPREMSINDFSKGIDSRARGTMRELPEGKGD